MASLRKRKISKIAFLVFGNQYSKKALNWMKRRKIKDDDDAWDARRKTNMIDDLPESLLSMEIFSKLNNPRDVIVCKTVSKRWNSLISSSSFHYNPSLALILNTHPPQCATNEISLEGWKGFELSKYIDPEFKTPICVLASYRDVLLCKKKTSSQRSTRAPFYIVNPVTMRWTRVPHTNNNFSTFPIGLSGNGSKGRYYVVMLVPCESPSKLELEIFDSKRGKWRYSCIEHPPWSQYGWCPTQRQALNLNGSLHWLIHDGPIIAYNPTNRHECIIIHRFQEMRHASYGDRPVVSETLTVSKGHLRIIQLVCYPFPEDHHHLRIWTLVDYKQSIWKQEHEPLYFREMSSGHQWIQDYMRGYNLATTDKHNMSYVMRFFMRPCDPEASRHRIICPQPLHCHPSNPLIVYLYLSESIVSVDVKTKKLRLIARVSKRGLSSVYWNHFDKVIPMTLELDPSFVPDHERVLLPRPKKTFC